MILPADAPSWLLPALCGLLGLLVGSFLNVVIHRLPRMMEREWRAQAQALLAVEPAPQDAAPAMNLVHPRSACPACGATIPAWRNIPVLSWILLRGRCADCSAPISARYPLVEAGTALLSALLALRFGLGPELAGALLLAWSLVALAIIDLDHQLLPDSITLPLTWAGLLFVLAGRSAGSQVFAAALPDAVIGAVAGYMSLWLVYHGFRLLTGKEGMGYGDFKLFAALGAWLGWQMLPLVILLSAATGAVLGIALIAAGRQRREVPMPFGPFLAAAGLVALFIGPELMSAWLGPPG
ncbi:MAG: prepilin peptidase [Chromatiales bacterium]|nr:prepilin peptidase [Chromatiales bacterium]